jgi:hypothetical protein
MTDGNIKRGRGRPRLYPEGEAVKASRQLYNERERQAGNRQMTFWIPAERVAEMRDILAQWRQQRAERCQAAMEEADASAVGGDSPASRQLSSPSENPGAVMIAWLQGVTWNSPWEAEVTIQSSSAIAVIHVKPDDVAVEMGGAMTPVHDLESGLRLIADTWGITISNQNGSLRVLSGLERSQSAHFNMTIAAGVRPHRG